MTSETKLRIEDLILDEEIQPRCSLDKKTIKEYAQDMEEGGNFPAVIVYCDGSNYRLADGWHRIKAAEKLGFEEIDAEVHNGSKRDALLWAVGANSIHGKRRTNADKRRAVRTLLRDDEWCGESDRWIGEACRVDHKTVAGVRAQLESTGETPQSDRRMGKDGRTINTANIGKTSTKTEPPHHSQAKGSENHSESFEPDLPPPSTTDRIGTAPIGSSSRDIQGNKANDDVHIIGQCGHIKEHMAKNHVLPKGTTLLLRVHNGCGGQSDLKIAFCFQCGQKIQIQQYIQARRVDTSKAGTKEKEVGVMT